MARVRLIGSDYSLAPPSRLELLSGNAERIHARLLELQRRQVIAGGVVVSTCNRFEVILELAGDEPESLASDLLGNDVPLRQCADGQAIDYLLGVATGLHSMVFGEEQILGQIRDAFRTAEDFGLLSRRLHMLRSRLLGHARDIRRRTGLDHRPPSIASLAVDQLLERGDRIAVVGAGATGRLVLEILQRRQVQPTLVVNRSLSKAQALAQHFGGRAISLREFTHDGGRPALDGAVFAIRSDVPLIDGGAVRGLRTAVDLSQPSVLAAEVRQQQGLEVLSLDDLNERAAPLRQRHAALRDMALVEVQAVAQQLWSELDAGRPNLGRIVDLHVEGALAELERAFSTHLSHLTGPDREHVRSVLERAARRNAHYHIRDLRQLAPK